MEPDRVDVWIGILRDAIIVALATFMLIYETAFQSAPNVEVMAVALALFGVPGVLRLDLRTRGEKKGDQPPPDKDERWSHLE